MTYQEAIRILHPDTTLEALAEYEYYGGFNGKGAKIKAVEEACVVACEAMQRLIPKKPVGRHTDYRCSVCGTRVRSGQGSSSRIKDTVCRKCFTVLDWSGV